MDVAVAMLHEASPKTRFVHMIDSVVAFIRESLPHARKIGVLSTKGTYATGPVSYTHLDVYKRQA